jgi:DNA-binding SARP family transcriptional activator
MVVLPSGDRDEQLIDLRDGVDEPVGLRIEVIGPPSVRIDGVPVRFATRHAELAVYLLALAGPAGIDAGTMGRWLWPSAPPHRWGPRLRTLLWQVRSALADEAWRLRRQGPAVVLDLARAEVDVVELGLFGAPAPAEVGLLALSARVGATRPVLEGWGATAMLAELGVDVPGYGFGHAASAATGLAG